MTQEPRVDFKSDNKTVKIRLRLDSDVRDFFRAQENYEGLINQILLDHVNESNRSKLSTEIGQLPS